MNVSSNNAKLILVAFLIACTGLLATGCGGSSSDDGGESTEQAQQAQQEIQEQKEVAAVQKAKAEQKAKDAKKEAEAVQAQKDKDAASMEAQEQADVAAQQNAPGAKTDCGGGVQAGPNTSCSFAENVADKFRESGQTDLSVYSPTTGETYSMSCGPWSNAGTVCKGGNNASVYISG